MYCYTDVMFHHRVSFIPVLGKVILACILFLKESAKVLWYKSKGITDVVIFLWF